MTNIKLRLVLVTIAVGTVGLLGLAACGNHPTGAPMSAESTALTALGFSDDDVALTSDPSPSVSASAHPGKAHRSLGRRLTIRSALGKNVEHGEVVVKTPTGDETVEVQRGTVTAINSTTVTVKSADGFSETWTFGNPIHVIQHRTTVQPSDVTVGTDVGVAGKKSGSTLTANLLVIPNPK